MVMSKPHDGLAMQNWSKPTSGLVMSKPNRLERNDFQTKCLCREPQRQCADWTGHILPTVGWTIFPRTWVNILLITWMKNHSEKPRYGARKGGSLSNTVKLILRLFLYHFLHTMSLWCQESIHNNTNNQQTPPPWWWSRLPLQWHGFYESMPPKGQAALPKYCLMPMLKDFFDLLN